MTDFIRKWWRVLLSGGMLVLVFQLFIARGDGGGPTVGRFVGIDVFRPVTAAVGLVTRGASVVWGRYVALVGVETRNESLRREVANLRTKLDAQRETVMENRRLKDLLRIAATSDRPVIGARVVGREVSPWFQAIFIDAGSGSGVEPGMAVLTPAGGVGRVHKVSRGISEVVLLSDGRFTADVIVERGRVRAVAEGAGEGTVRLKYVSATNDVRPGDRVIFSGFDGSMPKGTVLGPVVSVDRPKESLFQKVVVQCAAPTDAEEVLVVMARPAIPFRPVP